MHKTRTRQTSAETPSSGLGSAVQAERITAITTPAARLLLVASVVMAGVSLSANLAGFDDLEAPSTLRIAMHASSVATLVFSMVAGAYSASTDHRFGLIDQRLLSQANRQTVLAAKALVAAGVGLLYGVFGAVTALAAGTAFYASQGANFAISSPVVTRALIGVLIAAPLFALLGVAVGTLARNQPIAIGGSLAWMLIIEPAAILGLPDLGRWFPGAAGLALTYSPDDVLLTQTGGGVLLFCITAAALAAALHRFSVSDI